MEELISLYLFQYKKCPLPSIGSLQLTDGHANVRYIEKTILPPVPSIDLIHTEIPADNFYKFIASRNNISVDEANKRLSDFCKKLESLDAYTEVKLPCAGKFYVDVDGILVFRQAEPEKIFLPVITAERLIHPEVAHSMMVGDRETTTTAMTEFYSDGQPVKKDRWWIWALVLMAIVVIAVLIYLDDPHHSPSFGNGAQLIPGVEEVTYKTVN